MQLCAWARLLVVLCADRCRAVGRSLYAACFVPCMAPVHASRYRGRACLMSPASECCVPQTMCSRHTLTMQLLMSTSHHPPLPQGMEGYGFATQLRAALEDGGNAGAREGALLAYRALAENVGRAAEPYIVPLLNSVLERLADKAAPVSGSFLCVSCLFRTDMRGVSVLVWVAAPVRPCAGWPCSLLIVVCDWARLGLAYWGRMGGVLGFVDSLCLGGHGVCHG